ncbi:MAG: hypothetical protein ACK5PS_17780 [Desulfopila sp.]
MGEKSTLKRYSRYICIHLAILVACPVLAYAEQQQLVQFQAPLATDGELDTMRGGFTVGDGLEISFGIEQAVLVDGVLQIASSFNTVPVAELLARHSAMPATMPTLTNAQNIRSQVTTVIQNTLDQKVIDQITVMNASINSLSLSRQMNMAHAFQQLSIAERR